MGNFRDKILAAQAVAVRYRQAKLAGLSGAEALGDLAALIAADTYETMSPLTTMCSVFVEPRNKDSKWGCTDHLAKDLSATLFDQFSEKPFSWDPDKATIYTWFRRNLAWRWSDLCEAEFRNQKGRVHDALDPETGETVDRLSLVPGKSDKGEAWESDAAAKVRSFVQNDLPEKLRIVAMECWFNGSDPKPQKLIAQEQGVAEATVTLWKTEAREAITDFVYSLSS